LSVWGLIQRNEQKSTPSLPAERSYESLKIETGDRFAARPPLQVLDGVVQVQSPLRDSIRGVATGKSGESYVLTWARSSAAHVGQLTVSAHISGWDLLWQRDVASSVREDESFLLNSGQQLLVVTRRFDERHASLLSFRVDDGVSGDTVILASDQTRLTAARNLADERVLLAGHFSGTLVVNSAAGQRVLLEGADGPGFVLMRASDGTFSAVRNPDIERLEVYTLAAAEDEGSFVVVGQASEADREVSIVRVSADGITEWTHSLVSSESLSIRDVTVAADGAVVLAGDFSGTLSIAGGRPVAESVAGTDGLLFALDSRGRYRWVTTVRGSGSDWVSTVAQSTPEMLVAGGSFSGCVDLDPGLSAVLSCSTGTSDGLVLTVHAEDGTVNAVEFYSGPGEDSVSVVDVAADGVLRVAGQFSHSVDIDSSLRARVLRSAGGLDAWLMETPNRQSRGTVAKK
jgi:hypothetical protein